MSFEDCAMCADVNIYGMQESFLVLISFRNIRIQRVFNFTSRIYTENLFTRALSVGCFLEYCLSTFSLGPCLSTSSLRPCLSTWSLWFRTYSRGYILRTRLDQCEFDPFSDHRRLLTAAIRYVFNIAYVIWAIVNYVRLSCNKKLKWDFFYFFII